MSRSSANEIQQRTQIVSERQNENRDDEEMLISNGNTDDQQAQIRRRAPTRHSIKSLSSRKSLNKQASITEVNLFLFSRFFFLLLRKIASRF